MRAILWVLILLAGAGPAVYGATGKVIKVLPHLVDQKGRVALSPSLYDRDAYQAELRQKPEMRSGIRFQVHWKAKGPVWKPLVLKIELRGIARGNLPRELVIEKTVEKPGLFGRWTSVDLTGQQFKDFGEVTAWRVTLWEGDWPLDDYKSFLW